MQCEQIQEIYDKQNIQRAVTLAQIQKEIMEKFETVTLFVILLICLHQRRFMHLNYIFGESV